MKKLLVFGVIVLFLGIAVAPSNAGSQNTTIEDNIKKFTEILEKNNWEPDLYLISLILLNRLIRGMNLIDKTSNWWIKEHEKLKISHPLIFIRGWWLVSTTFVFGFILDIIVEIMGWNSKPPSP